MGKLGGGELNVSSDIDLIFVYPDEGETAGPRPIANREFFDRLGQRVIAALHDVTPSGYVFRVDMRLRPYGESGPLTTTFAGLEAYLVTQGRAWERYAWLKARALTGDRRERTRCARDALRVSQVPGLRRLRRPARRASPDPRTGLAARLHRQREARRRRHPRDRIHRAGAADRARRPRARAARQGHAARADRARRRAACCRSPRSSRCATPTFSCAASSIACSIATTSRRTRFPANAEERALLAASMGLRGAARIRRGARPPSCAGQRAVRARLRRSWAHRRGRRSATVHRDLGGAAGVGHGARTTALGRGFADPGRAAGHARARSRAAAATCNCRHCRGSASTR